MTEKSDIRIVRDDRIISNDIILERATFRGEDLYLLSNCDTLRSMILPVKDTKRICRDFVNHGIGESKTHDKNGNGDL